MEEGDYEIYLEKIVDLLREVITELKQVRRQIAQLPSEMDRS